MRSAALLLAVVAFALGVSLALGAATATPNSVVVNADGTMTVDGAPFKIKGIAYSVVPVGETERAGVEGDYFTADYAYMWHRDFPRLKAMGVNTLRIYSWGEAADHTAFLDTCTQYGLHVFVTHALGFARDHPVRTVEQQQALAQGFADEVARYGDHPAILMWSFGNELNGWWLGFLGDFNVAYSCGWNTRQWWDNNGCILSTTPECLVAQDCIYSHYFGWIDGAIALAKQHTTRPITATLADVDNIVGSHPTTDLLPRFMDNMAHFDAFAFQLYRGQSFYSADGTSYFSQYGAEAGGKPLIVAEYGVDAMNDPCGWPENYYMQPCKVWSPGQNGQPGGTDDTGAAFVGCSNPSLPCRKPGVSAQAEWDASLTGEIMTAPHTLGGFLFEWHDEYWKNVETQDFCETPSSVADVAANTAGIELGNAYNKTTNSAGCTYKAHITCGNSDSTYHDICGYYLESAPDQYVNEAWFGLNGVVDCGDMVGTTHHLTALTPRPVIKAITVVYGGEGGAAAVQPTCAQLRPCYQCVTGHTAQEVAAGQCTAVCKQLDVVQPGENGSTGGSDSSTGGSSSSSSSTGGGSTGGSGGSTSSSSSSSGSNPPVVSSSSTGGNDGGDGGVDPSGSAAGLTPALTTVLLALLAAMIVV